MATIVKTPSMNRRIREARKNDRPCPVGNAVAQLERGGEAVLARILLVAAEAWYTGKPILEMLAEDGVDQ